MAGRAQALLVGVPDSGYDPTLHGLALAGPLFVLRALTSPLAPISALLAGRVLDSHPLPLVGFSVALSRGVEQVLGVPRSCGMPHYFFDVRYDDDPWSPDQEGVGLVSRQLARAEALDLIGELAKDEVQQHQLIAVGVRDHGADHFLEVVLSITVQPPD